jgi:YjbE family integral membrane protein
VSNRPASVPAASSDSPFWPTRTIFWLTAGPIAAAQYRHSGPVADDGEAARECTPSLIEQTVALFQVILIDLALAADNAIVIGVAAAALPKQQRRQAIVIGIIGATVCRILFATFTTTLLEIVGLLVAGGILLLWVAWKMWRGLIHSAEEAAPVLLGGPADADGANPSAPPEAAPSPPRGRLRDAALQIVIADISMSLDNVLAVAGAAREHVWVLALGLSISIVLMGAAAAWVASLLHRHRWIAYLGLLTVIYVALSMIWEGSMEVIDHVEASAGF